MNVFEFHERYKISLTKARLIAKENPHWFDGTSTATDAARATIAKGNAPTAMQLVELIENPASLLELGKYVDTAEREIAKLGNPLGQVAPKEVVANIMEAAKGEPEAVEILVNWLKSITGDSPVGHAFIAVRLLLGTPASIRKSEGPRIPRALLNARNHPDFAGWWHTKPDGKNRNVTIYQKKAFDL